MGSAVGLHGQLLPGIWNLAGSGIGSILTYCYHEEVKSDVFKWKLRMFQDLTGGTQWMKSCNTGAWVHYESRRFHVP